MSNVRQVAIATLALLAGLTAGGAGAQQVYRIVGPDGRVTFSDKPPPENQGRATPAPTVTMPAGAPAASGGGGPLPFELRSISTRYPVTLYTGQDCGPCTSGRTFLASRGIPFSERTISSEEDIEALKRLSGAARLPLLTIGGQQLKGFSEPEWAQYLDAAGYPKVSQLPGSYRNPPPRPMVAATQPQEQQQRPPAAAARPADAPPPQADAQPPAEDSDNPARIRF